MIESRDSRSSNELKNSTLPRVNLMSTEERQNIMDILKDEVQISHARSSGAGGQHVNKTETKAVLKWSVDNSKAFSAEQKQRIKEKLKNRINKEGYLVMSYSKTRSQATNIEVVMQNFEVLVFDSLKEPKARKTTKPTAASKAKRKKDKQKLSKKKALRGSKPTKDSW